jgi:NitT/TauT family transport system substrate-binding protein
MIRKSPAIGFFCAIVVCLITSCSGGISAATQVPLKVGWTLWQGDYTLLVANQMGFFNKNGVNVETIRYDSSTQAIPDLAGAKLDGGLYTMSDLMLASNLADIEGVMVSDNGGQYSIVASPGIKNVSGLRGKRIGLNLHTSSEIFVSDMLKTARMTANNVTYTEMPPNQVSKSIPDQIDAGLVWEPYTAQALKQGKVIVYQSADESALFPRLLVFSKAIIEQRPQDIRAFIQAWDEAVQYRISHPQESLAIISKATGLSATDLALTSTITIYPISDNIKLFANNPGTDPSSIYFTAGANRDFLITAGYLTVSPDINSLLNPSFLK